LSGRFVPRMAALAQRQLRNDFSEDVAISVLAFAQRTLSADPRACGSPLDGPDDGVWRMRRRDYTVYYEIDDHAGEVTITAVRPTGSEERSTPAR
jgi:mRNA-degrading endonuclease RelE of RelBE toxin-antitoxin system